MRLVSYRVSLLQEGGGKDSNKEEGPDENKFDAFLGNDAGMFAGTV